MKHFSGNGHKILVSNVLRGAVCDRYVGDIRTKIIDAGVIEDNNKHAFNQWLDSLSIEELVNVESYCIKLGYYTVGSILNQAISEFAEDM